MTESPAARRDLRLALIAAGEEILDEQGLAALTLRAIAMRAGVSHAAPAHHFPEGLKALRAAIAARGFARFRAAMLEERAAAGPDPRDRLLAICRGYLRFAEQQRPFFELIFGPSSDPCHDADLERESRAAFAILSEACAPFAPVGAHPASTEAMVWSLVHGLAMLRLNGRLAVPGENRQAEIEDILPALRLR